MKLKTNLIKIHIAAILAVAAVAAQAGAPKPASQEIKDCLTIEVRNLQAYIPWDGIVESPTYVSHRLTSQCDRQVVVTYTGQNGTNGSVTLNKGGSRDVNGNKGSFQARFN